MSLDLSNLRIVADENIPAVETLFGGFGKITRLPGRTMAQEDLKQADILLVRSVTKVNETILADSPIKFVGTATIGTDHIDQTLLAEQGMHFSSAPGCNADAVAEYVISNLLMVAREQGFDLRDKVVGIVGVGNVGGRLQQRFARLNISLLLNDPPRQESGATGMVGLDELLQKSDIICLHTPLTRTGAFPSYHLLNAENLKQIKSGAILLNAGRGPVIDNKALYEWYGQRQDVTLLLDVWEEEPLVDAELAQQCRIGTPHIAGYSLDGKIRGTWMLYRAFCQAFGVEAEIELDDVIAQTGRLPVELKGDEDLADIVHAIYHPQADHDRFLESLNPPESQPVQFDQLRKTYPVRREFAAAELSGIDPGQKLKDALRAVGFIL